MVRRVEIWSGGRNSELLGGEKRHLPAVVPQHSPHAKIETGEKRQLFPLQIMLQKEVAEDLPFK
jgi:hypothetical protein